MPRQVRASLVVCGKPGYEARLGPYMITYHPCTSSRNLQERGETTDKNVLSIAVVFRVSTHGHLEFQGPKNGVGCCMHLYAQRYTIGSSKMGGGCLYRDGCLLGTLPVSA